jgi:aryl-alcohol dehydrogenase
LNPAYPELSAVVVFGAGAVGMAAIFAAAAIKMKTIIAVDLQDSRLELAESLGATHTINGSRKGKLRATLSEWFAISATETC